jgi:hypothetical protein
LTAFNGELYAGVESAGVFRSRDGMVWKSATPRFGPKSGVRAAIVRDGFLYVGTTSGGEVWRTPDGEAWERVLAIPASRGGRGGYVASLAEAGGALFASVNGRIQRSPDGRSWTEVGELSPFTVEAMGAFDGALYAGTTLPPRAWVYRAPIATRPNETFAPGATP